jgi:uncharacterized lipoprotein NlpE involved in copper resistance
MKGDSMPRPTPKAKWLTAALLGALTASLHAQPVRWRGDFVYFADSAIFTDCASGKRWPVAMSDDFLALQHAYMQWRGEPKAPLLANFDGRLEVREAMEGPAREHIVIDRFVSVQPGTTCESISASLKQRQ